VCILIQKKDFDQRSRGEGGGNPAIQCDLWKKRQDHGSPGGGSVGITMRGHAIPFQTAES